MEANSRVLVVGGFGHIGKFIAFASLSHGHPTTVLLRPGPFPDPKKLELLVQLKRAGAKIIKASLDDHQALISALKQVDVVISAIAEDYLEDQRKLISAMKEAGNIKRFFPSEYGMDPDKMHNCTKPGDEIFVIKRSIRRAVEEAGIPHTYIVANCTAAWFIGPLCQITGNFMPPMDKVYIYGSGNKKAIFVDESDIANYTVLCVNDPRTCNTTVHLRPPRNILSQNELVALWESKSGARLEKIYISKEGIFKLVENSTYRYQLAAAHFYDIFQEGLLLFDIPENEKSSNDLYPNVSYTTVDSYLDLFVCD